MGVPVLERVITNVIWKSCNDGGIGLPGRIAKCELHYVSTVAVLASPRTLGSAKLALLGNRPHRKASERVEW